jgi:hypothetical protein
MAHQVQWTTNLQITGGPTFSLPGSVSVDAYDHIEVSVKKGQSSAKVDLPGQAGQVLLVLITSSTFDNITYTAGTVKGIPLDATQLFAGKGAVGRLGDAPITLTFDNTKGSQDADVEILVGRNTA